MMTSLYDRVGGEKAIMAAVPRFYTKLLEDPRTRPYFEGLDLEKQIAKQVSFLARAFGGPDAYKGRDLRTAHAGLLARGLRDEHFDAMLEHLDATLVELEVGPAERAEVRALVESHRATVLGR